MPGRASPHDCGRAGEAAARAHLERAGLVTLESNARYRCGELDLVMRDGAALVFVEVRYRRDARFGGSLVSVTAGKRRRLVQAAQSWLAAHPEQALRPCRFDVVALSGPVDAPQLQWLRDAFRPDDPA